MAAALVQSTKKVVTGVNNTTLAYVSSPTAGNLLCVSHAHWQGSSLNIPTPTDTLGHTYVGMSAEQKAAATLATLRSFYVANCSGGADTVTFDMSGVNGGDMTVVVAEFSGIVTASPLDQTAVGGPTNSASVATAATATTAQADELLWAAMIFEGGTTTLTPTNGFTVVQENLTGSTNMTISTAYKVVSATGAYTYTATLGAASSWVTHIAAFKAVAAGGAAPTLPQLERMTRGLERGMNQAA